jgi:outer membrane protein assembly factor BamB
VENGPSGKGTFYFVTETDDVYAVDETTGATVWTRNVGPPAAMSGAGCGNVSPLGITGTPVIDLARRAMYFDAVLATAPGDGGVIQTHLIHAVSIDDGAELPGWPVDTRNVSYGTLHFDPVSQNQRGALVIAGDTVYVPYGGHAGDCAHAGVFYHGWVIGVPLDDPAGTKAWATDAQLASIWGPGGLSSDGTSVFGATGNSLAFEQPGVTPFQHQNSVVRLQPGPVFSGQTTDFFAPANWVDLDNADLDLGGSGVLLVDVPGANPAHLAVALGKDGKAYLTDRTNLGGVGGDAGASPPATPALVAGNPIVGAPAWYTTAQGVYVVFVIDEYLRTAIGCAIGQGGDLAALRIHPGAPPTVTVAWCQDSHGIGSPSVTVAGSDTLVWTAGALESGKLHAFDGDTGDPVYTSAETMGPLTHWIVPIAVHGRIIVGGNGAAYAFKP